VNGSPNAGAEALNKENKPIPIDTVSLSSRSFPATPDATIEEAKKKAAEAKVVFKKPDQPAAKVEFVYDQKGDLITKYMDSANRLIYQTPSELMLLLREASASVDTEA